MSGRMSLQALQQLGLAAVLLARMTGDPARDIQPGLRKQVLRRLQREKSPSRWIGVVSEKSSLSERDTRQLFGDSLPTGVYAVPERFSLAELLAVIEGITGRQVRGDGLL